MLSIRGGKSLRTVFHTTSTSTPKDAWMTLSRIPTSRGLVLDKNVEVTSRYLLSPDVGAEQADYASVWLTLTSRLL